MKTFFALITFIAFISSAFAFRVTDQTLDLGTGASNKQLIFNKGSGSGNPRIRWNNSLSRIEHSNDGSSFSPIGGVSSVNSETGAITIAAGPNVNIGTSGGVITITGTASSASRVYYNFENGAGYGSSGSAIRRFTDTVANTDTDSSLNCADSGTDGLSCTVNSGKDGNYAMTACDIVAGTNQAVGISKNSNQLSTQINGITQAHRLVNGTCASNTLCCVSITVPLTAGDVVRHHGVAGGASSNQVRFSITKITN